MTVRAKFKCSSVEKVADWRNPNKFLYTAKFGAVSDSSPENKSFWEATPNGVLTLTSILEDSFVPGIEYYLDITGSA
jgi:hypothetical protein